MVFKPSSSYNRLFLTLSLFSLLINMLASSALAEEKTRIEVIGPVPKFQEHQRQKKWTERWYYDVQFPEFHIEPIDTLLINYVDGLLADVPRYARSAEHPEATPVEDIWSQLGIASTVSASSPRYMTVLFTIWDHGGGAHAQYYSTAFSFDLKTNKRMTLSDVFPRWNVSNKKLKLLIQEILVEGEYNIEGMNASFDPTIQYPDSTAFQLTPDGIQLLFNYDIPALWNNSSLFIPKDKLIRIGAESKLWNTSKN